VATAVELRFDIDNSSLPPDMKLRLKALAGRKALTDGVLMIDSREHRTQSRNRGAARERLMELIQLAAIPPKKRTPTRLTKAAKERRLAGKHHHASVKKTRTTRPDRDE